MMPIGIGIIGTGGISRAHVAAYRQLADQARLVAVADIDLQRAHAAAAEWGVEHAFADYRELLDLKEVEAVSVCTFNQAHCAPTVAALEAGKHVLVEKPMATTTEEAWRMVQAARRNSKLLMVEMKWRFMPQILAARQSIQRGELGRIYYAEAIGWQHRGIPGGTFIQQETAGGGALMDNGVYTLDAILHLLGHPRPLTVSGTAETTFGRSPGGSWDPQRFSVEDFGIAYVRLEGGITLYFAHSWSINFPEQWQLRVAGEQGSVEIRPFGPEPTLRICQGGYTDLKDVTPVEAEWPAGSIEVEYAVRQFVEAIRHKRPSPVPGETFLYTNVIFDGIYASSRQGGEVAVEVPGV
jgi:predicted dehydrogenase